MPELKKIEIISHCYAEKLPLYASGLCYQMSSLALLSPMVAKDIMLTICCAWNDAEVYKVLEFFSSFRKHFQVRLIPLNIHSLGRRAIGRNVAALSTDADIVWFSDVDQVFCDGILERLMSMKWPDGVTMVYPKTIMIHRDHATGDAALAKVRDDPKIIEIDKTKFILKRYRKAIGGVQIVHGDYARKYGYLQGTKWVKPIDENEFLACRCDTAFRKMMIEEYGGKSVGVDLPGLYRLRHSEAGHGRTPKL